MQDLPPIDCSEKSPENITKTIHTHLQTIRLPETITRITLENIPSQIYRALDLHALRKLGSPALHFEIKTSLKQPQSPYITQHHRLSSLAQEFIHYLQNQDIPNKKDLQKLGLDYLNKMESPHDQL